ncbi:MAG: prohibitin family protein [Bdellovibrionales bacterium]|nr:prohibitin family protein [Bdellovibrionales bacterium]
MRKLLTLLMFAMVVAMLTGCVVVEDGTVGVSKSFGTINEEPLAPGVYPSVPVVREIEVWNVKTQRRSLDLTIPSAEGLIVGLQTTVLFRPEEVVRLRKEVGPGFVQVVLDATLTDTFREVIGKQKVEEIITNQESLTSATYEKLRESLGSRGVVVEDLMVTGLELPVKFKDAIERKLEQEQKALQKSFELAQAQKDAEIEVARARGAAEAQEIVRSTLSAEYLQYLWISTLNQNPNVIYVATESNMPMFRVADFEPISKSPGLPKSVSTPPVTKPAQ